MGSWSDTIQRFGVLFVELLVLFIVVTWGLAVAQRKWLSVERIHRILGGKRRMSGLFKGALLGAVTPFCSCAGVPVLIALVRAGVPFSTSMAFLISSPLLDVPILGLIGVLYGWDIVIVYSVVTFFGSMALAALVDAMGMVKHVKLGVREIKVGGKTMVLPGTPAATSAITRAVAASGSGGATATATATAPAATATATLAPACDTAVTTAPSGNGGTTATAPACDGGVATVPSCNGEVTATPTVCAGGDGVVTPECTPEQKEDCSVRSEEVPWRGFRVESRDAWKDSVETLRPLVLRMFIGVAIGALIYGGVPRDALVGIAGPNNPLAVPVAALIGIPLYLRGEAALPIGYALLEAGVGIGAVFAMVIAGAGASLPELTMLSGVFKRPLLLSFVLCVFGVAVLGGWLIPLFT